MELGQIKYFILTAQLQNISKAAESLDVAQPTLSRSIAALEKELGTQLFDRIGKKLILNERGKSFLVSAKRSVEELENAAAAARERVADLSLNIGMFCMSERLVRCAGSFAAENPELLINIIHLHGNTSHIDTNEYDVLLYPRDSLYRRYSGQQAYTERYLLAVHAESSLAALTQVRLSELSDANLIFVRSDEKVYDSPYQLFREKLPERHSFHFCNSYELQRQMISSRLGVGFVPEGGSGAYLTDSSISLIPVSDPGFEQDILIGFKREKHLSEYGRMLMKHISGHFSLSD